MRTYVIAGVILCVLFVAAGMRGYVYLSMFRPAQWSPLGQGVHK